MNYNHINPEDMTKYLADELEPGEKKECELHFSVCPECAAKLDEERRFEQAAKKSYSADFSERLGNEDAQQIDSLLLHDLTTEMKSSFWSKRVCGAAWVQISAILVMAILLVVMILVPESPEKKVQPEIQKANEAVEKAVPVEKKQEAAETEEKNQSAAKPAATVPPRPAPMPESVAVSAKTEPVMPPPARQEKKAKSVLNPGLVRFLRIDQISPDIKNIEANPNQLQAGCVLSPFEPDVYILTAFCGNDNKEIQIDAGTDSVILSELGSQNRKNIRTAAVKAEKTGHPLAVIQIKDENIPALAVSAKDAVPDFEQAAENLRLAAILHAAGNPKLVLHKNTREKMMAELDKLIQGGYANDQAVLLFRKQMGKIK